MLSFMKTACHLNVIKGDREEQREDGVRISLLQESRLKTVFEIIFLSYEATGCILFAIGHVYKV
jgi:hypothetical protein